MTEALGFALGVLGLSLEDFCCLTPEEYNETARQWQQLRDLGERGDWERVRMMCLCMLQPYAKGELKARDVMVFPWEEEREEERVSEAAKGLSREELMAEFERVKKERGLR